MDTIKKILNWNQNLTEGFFGASFELGRGYRDPEGVIYTRKKTPKEEEQDAIRELRRKMGVDLPDFNSDPSPDIDLPNFEN